MDESAEFNNFYLPDLLRYVVAIFSRKCELGSGVLVTSGGRHFVATAAHCIQDGPQVVLCTAPVNLTRPVEMRRLRILDTGWHPSLDIGYLEIEDPRSQELTWSHLSEGPVEKVVHVVGYPTTHASVDHERSEITIGQNAFQTSVIEVTPDYLKLDYPKQGSSYDAASGTWVPCEFPVTPKGYSGGGCFCVYKRAGGGGLDTIEYKLFGVQSCWHETKRYAKVIPIKQWCDLLRSRGLCPS